MKSVSVVTSVVSVVESLSTNQEITDMRNVIAPMSPDSSDRRVVYKNDGSGKKDNFWLGFICGIIIFWLWEHYGLRDVILEALLF